MPRSLSSFGLVLVLTLSSGCAVPPVPLGDVQSRVERREIKRQLRMLSSSEDEVWQAAYWRLADRGARVAPHLQQAFDAREPLASRAILVLGEIADPSTMAQLRALENDPRLGAVATRALLLSEEALWRTVLEEGGQAACEAYLTWFPGGQHRWEVQRRLTDIEATAAHAALGNNPDDQSVNKFLREFGDTELGNKVKKEQASELERRARILLEEGDVFGAHLALQEADRLGVGLDLREIESQIRSRMGRVFAAEGKLDKAIGEFTRALELGEGVEMELGRLLVERSSRKQEERDFLGALLDLDVADGVYSNLEAVTRRRRRSLEGQILGEIRNGTLEGDRVAEALLRSGEEGRRELRRRLDGGKNLVLVERLAMESIAGGGSVHRKFRLDAIDEVQARNEEQALAFLSDEAKIARLMDPEKLWHPSQGPSRDEARTVVNAYLKVEGWRDAVLRDESSDSSGSGSAVEPQEALNRRLAEEGQGPGDVSLSLGMRLQLLGRLMELHGELQVLVKQDLLSFSGGLVGRDHLPSSLAEWCMLVLQDANSEELTARNGSPARLSELRQETGVMVLRLDVSGEGISSELAVSEALTLLFGSARSIVQHHPNVDGIQVEVHSQGTRRVRVGLTRDSIRRINWPLVQAETPFGMDHLAFVFDQEVD